MKRRYVFGAVVAALLIAAALYLYGGARPLLVSHRC